jgi:RNA polymerase sigma-70 factor (ECF subfamily)
MQVLRIARPVGLRTVHNPDTSRKRNSYQCCKIPAEVWVPSTSDAADVTLIDRIARRDASAVAELYDQHSGLLYGLILRILKDRAEAAEVLQEVFVSVWTRAESYNVSLGTVVGWLVRIARNRAIDRLRARMSHDRALVRYPLPPPPETPETGAARSERRRAVMQALAALPPEQRTLIEEAYFGGLTHGELASRFGLPLGTVKTRIRTAMTSLRQQLREAAVG